MHLTEQNTKSSDSTVGGDMLPAGAPVHEIEITPAMIAAGVAMLFEFDRNYPDDDAPQAVEAIYAAMQKVRLKGRQLEAGALAS